MTKMATTMRWACASAWLFAIAIATASAQNVNPVTQPAAADPAPASEAAAPARAKSRPHRESSEAQQEAGEPRAATSTPSATGARPRGRNVADRVDLDTTTVTGNRELPKVMYVVPWKRADIGDLVGRPPNSLLDEVLAPVDRSVFRREVQYYQALKPDTAAAATPGSAASEPASTQGEK